MANGKPTIFVDGKPMNPMIYSITDAPGGRWTWEEFPRWNIRNFGKAGYKIIQFSIWLEDIWTADGKLDMELVRHQFAAILEEIPDAVLLMRLHINAPDWWDLANPDETVRYADTEGTPHKLHWGIERNTAGDDLDGGQLHSLASMKWRSETTAILERFFRELAAMPEGNRLGFVNVCDGVSHEWHNWGFLAHEPDTSKPMTAYFRQWLTKKYGTDAALRAAWNEPSASLGTAQVPGMGPRQQKSDGVFRDPVRERYVIDYYEAQQDIVADDILHFNGLIKRLWPRPLLLGNFYGYYFMTFSRQTSGGHLAVDRILQSSDVDFLAAPQSYAKVAHDVGGTGQSRALVESALLYGKLVLDEMDTFTATAHPFAEPKPEKLSEDISRIRRNTAHPLSRGAGMWYFDFGPRWQTGWWSHPIFTAEVKRLRELFEARLNQPLAPQSDVLVVWDTKSYYASVAGWTPISDTSTDVFSAAIGRSGVASDNILLDDLGKVELSRYRVVVFANNWMMNQKTRELVTQKVMRDGRHVLFIYMNGYSDGSRTDLAAVQKVTGINVVKTTPFGHAEIEVGEPGAAAQSYGISQFKTPLEPMPAVQDPEAELLGRYKGTSTYAYARKKRADGGTTWYSGLPITNSSVLRDIFKTAGAHVYNNANDALHSGNGILWIHTKDGGPRSIVLRNGKTLELTLAPESTVLIDSSSGELLMH